MRTNIVIDDALIDEAMTLTGIKTKREVVDEALRLLVEQKKESNALEGLRALRGKITFWEDVIEDIEAHRPKNAAYILDSPVLVLGEEKAEYHAQPTSGQTDGETDHDGLDDSSSHENEHEKQ